MSIPAFSDAETPRWLQRALAQVGDPAAKLPKWLKLDQLPSVIVQQHQLNAIQRHALVRALQTSNVEEEHKLVFALREYADRGSLDGFVRGLRDQWNAAGAPDGDLWVVNALACFEITD